MEATKKMRMQHGKRKKQVEQGPEQHHLCILPREKMKELSLVMRQPKKRGSTRSVVREKLYKSSVQKPKATLRIKMMKTRLANMIEEKKDMAESLETTKTDAAETEAEYRLLNTRRNKLVDELNSAKNDLVILREMENLLRGFL
ncbi:hypothetical protein CRYUN_Cryun09bG0207800 [Craigia yunnanensis]